MKIIIKILLLALFQQTLSVSILYSQYNLEWSKYFYCNNETARSLCIDDTSNVYVAGGNKIIMYSPSGDKKWDFNFPSNGISNKIIYNSFFIFAGGTSGLIKFTDPDNITLINNGIITDVLIGSHNYIFDVSNSGSNIITTKYTPLGSTVWSRIKQRLYYNFRSYNVYLGVNNTINIFGIFFIPSTPFPSNGPIFLSYDNDGNILLDEFLFSGYYLGIKNNFSNQNFISGFTEYSSWRSEVKLAKLDSANSVISSVNYNGIGNSRDEPNSIASDNSGNIYIACRSWGVSVDYDFVVLKYNSDLELLWEYRYNGSENSYDEAKKVIVGNSGNIYATGNVTMNNHGIQIFTVKLSPDGQLLWSDKFSRYDSPTDTNRVNDLLIDESENIFLCGNSRDSVNRRKDCLTLKYSNPTSISSSEVSKINNYSILQNYPNPFNPSTNIKFNLSEKSVVKIDIFNSLGKRIKELTNSEFSFGEHSVKWNADGLPSGIYFIHFKSGNFTDIKKAVLIK